MIDVLLQFASEDQAAAIGEQLGYTVRDPKTDKWVTTTATLTLAICVIGEHYYPDGTTTTGPHGDTVPVLKGDSQYWVMVRSLIEIPLPPEILPFIVARDPGNPEIPTQIWAGGID